MRVAMHNWMRAEPIEATIRRLGRFGYDAIEISGEPELYDTDQVRRLLDQHGVRCWGAVTLMTEGRDLISADRYVRWGTVRYMKDGISMIQALGGEIFCVVPSTVGKIVPMASPEQEWAWGVAGLREVGEWAGERGVRIGIEPLNRFETNFINRGDQALRLAQEVNLPNVGITLDAFHINIEEADPIGAIRAARGKLVDFHVADNNRRPPGEGNLDWGALIGALGEIGYQGCLTSEFVLPIDRTPLGEQIADENAEVSAAQEKFLRDHASASISESYYDRAVERTIQHLRRFS
jgi:D-psicose/D-tagatose/L-ribulose 3-epimerase